VHGEIRNALTRCINRVPLPVFRDNLLIRLASLGMAQAVLARSARMKLITAIIKPFKLDDVRKAVSEVGVQGLTVTEVRGFGRQRGHTEMYRGAEYAVEFLPKTKIEIAVDNALLDRVIDALMKAAYTGKVGDGKIFVFELVQTVRIRTGDRDTSAI
jgi:nitrogen regulatory protein P-II 2